MTGRCSTPRQTGRGRVQIRVAAFLLLASTLGAAHLLPAQEWVVLERPTTRDLNKLSFLDDQHGWVAGDSGTILVTTDGGATWGAQSSPVDFHVVDLEMIDGQRGWALAQQVPAPPTWEYGTTVLHTTNGGADWLVQSTFDDIFLHTLAFTDSAWGCVAGELGRLWWTSDGGAVWTESVVDSADFARWPIRDVKFHTPTYGLASGGFYDVTGIVWTTTDRGQFWTHTRVAGEPIFGIHFFDSLNVICVGGDLDYGAGMVQTSTGGAAWEYTYLGIWGQAEAIAFRTPTEGWSPLGFAGAVMKTIDSGGRWDWTYTPDSTAMHDIVFTDSTTGWMAGDAGTILRWVGDVTAVEPPDPRRAAATLDLRTYPNPFHPRARIDFRVPRDAPVSLRIYDVRGREVATLVDRRLAGGPHSRTLDGRDLPNGVYFCRLAVGSESATTKMLLVR